MKYSLILLFILALTIVSCSKDNQVPLQSEIRSCHDSQNLDVNEISERLVGEWELVMVMCYSNPTRETESSTGFLLDFNQNGELNITNTDNSISTATWRIEERFTNMYEIVTESSIQEIKGIIVLCEDRVELRLSYIDQCDHRFKRIE